MFRQYGSRVHFARQARWRPSPATALWFGILAGGFLVLNLIGRPSVEPDIDVHVGGNRELMQLETTLAGWPLPYLAVQRDSLVPLWDVEDLAVWFSWTAVTVNLAAGVAMTILGALLLGSWRRIHRRWWQFSLCDLAIATTLVSFTLSLMVVPCVRHARESRTLAQLSGLTGVAYQRRYCHEPRTVVWQPAWFAELEPWLPAALPPAGHAVGLDVYACESQRIAQLRGLKTLRLFGTVTDQDMARLAALPQLECLDLSEARLRVEQEGLPDFSTRLANDPVSFPRLKRLHGRCGVFPDCDRTSLPALEELYLTGAGFKPLSCKSIASLTTLRILDLHDSDLTDELLAEFSALPRLTMLDLSGTNVTDAGLVQLRRLPRLEIVWLARMAVSDAGLDSLQACPNLKSVRLTGSRVSGRGLASFSRSRPDCAVLP